MLHRARWIELVYCGTGNVVLITWLCGAFLHWRNVQESVPLLLMCVLLIGFGVLMLAFAMLCTAAIACALLKRYSTARKLYEVSLRIRQSLPIIGTTARVDFWRISLANCYRDEKLYEKAEALYCEAIESQKQLCGVDRMAQYGLRSVALCNYAILLNMMGRRHQAESALSEAGCSADVVVLKYVVATIVVLSIGLGSTWFLTRF